MRTESAAASVPRRRLASFGAGACLLACGIVGAPGVSACEVKSRDSAGSFCAASFSVPSVATVVDTALRPSPRTDRIGPLLDLLRVDPGLLIDNPSAFGRQARMDGMPPLRLTMALMDSYVGDGGGVSAGDSATISDFVTAGVPFAFRRTEAEEAVAWTAPEAAPGHDPATHSLRMATAIDVSHGAVIRIAQAATEEAPASRLPVAAQEPPALGSTAEDSAARSSAPAADARAEPPGRTPIQPSRLGLLPGLLMVNPVLPVDIPPAPGADEHYSRPLSMRDALTLGLAFSAEIAVAEAQDDAQSATTRATWRQLGPKLDLRVAGGRGQYRGQLSTPMPPAMFRGDNMVILRQPLVDWAGINEALRQDMNSEKSSHALHATTAQSVNEVGTVFLSVVQSLLIVGFTADYESRLGELLTHIRNRTEVGGASGADYERVKSRVDNTRALLSENRAGLMVNLSQLYRLIGAWPQQIVVPESLGIVIPEHLDTALLTANANNPDLRAARSQLESNRYERRAAEGKFAPRLDLEVAQTVQKNSTGNEAVSTDRRTLLVMNWNLFNSGSDLAARDITLAKERESRWKLTSGERRIRQQIQSDYSILSSIAARFDSVQREVAANQKVVEAFDIQLNLANRQLLDVLDAHQRLYQSKVDMTNLLITDAQVQLQVSQLLGARQSIAGDGVQR